MYEGELELVALFKKESIKMGETGFPCEITSASGRNALYFHYKDKKMKSADCLLFDAGVEYNHYPSDFSRTVHISEVKKEQND